jgi:hypothetical protein
MLTLLLTLQIFHVVFLLLHDWVPLGALNDTAAVRAEHPAWKMLLGTLVSTLPFIVLLGFSLHFQHRGYPRSLMLGLWAGYIFLFMGELEAWWLPWLGRPVKPERVASYERMFGATHAFLPARNGIRINTLHFILHAATVATLVVLGVLTF